MTYTKHRSTAETLAILDSLELDTVRSSQQELIRRFGWDDDFGYTNGRLPRHRRWMLIVWQIFEEPRSSTIAKVLCVNIVLVRDRSFI